MAGPPPLDPSKMSEDRAPLIIGTVAMLLALGTVSVALRIYTRRVLMNNMGVDDWLILGALITTWGDGVIVVYNIRYGAGKHVGTFDPALIPLYFRGFYISIVLYMVSLFFLKTTFLAQYYRVFFTQKSRGFFFLIAFVVCGWSVSQVFVGIFLCYPIRGFWDKTVDARCIPTNAQWHINAAGNIATDVVVFVMPLPVIGQLNLARTQKMLLMALFSLGFFTVAISVIRIQYLKLFEDVTWENVAPACWSIAELTTALICASLSTLRPFMSRYFPGLTSHVSARRSSYLRQAESGSNSRPGVGSGSGPGPERGHGHRHGRGHKRWGIGSTFASLDMSAERREAKDELRFIKQHGYELTTHPSKPSSIESNHGYVRSTNIGTVPRTQDEYDRIVALRATTTTEVESVPASGDVLYAPRSNTPSGQWILVRHDILQTKEVV